MKLELIVTTFGLIGTFPVYKSWGVALFKWNRNRSIKKLEKQKEHLTMLNQDLNYLIRWIGESILIILAIISAAFMFEAVAADPDGQQLSSLLVSFMVMFAYLTSVYKLGEYKRLKNYQKTIKYLEKKIKDLQA